LASGVELATAYVSLVAETSKLKNDINKAFEEADKSSLRAGKKIGKNLDSGLSGTKTSAAKAGEDAADAYEKSLKSQLRGERIGQAIGKPIGKALGLALKVGIAGAASTAAAGVGVLATALTKGFGRLRQIDNAKFKLQALGNSAEDVNKIMDSALASVKGTAFGMEEAATTAASAVAAGIVPGEELTKYLTNAADAAAIAGTSLEEMGSIFNNIQTSNKAFTDDLRQLSDRGLPVFTWLQNEYGVTAEALTKMVENGEVDAATFNKVIRENIGGAAQEMGNSFDGAMQNLSAALGRVGATILSTPFENASGGIGSITDALDRLDGWLKGNQEGVIGFWGTFGRAAITGAQDVLRTIAEITRAVAQFQNFFGDIYGGMDTGVAWINDVLGRDDIAEGLRERAERSFGWGEEAYEMADRIDDMIESLDEAKTGVSEWETKAKAAAAVTKALGDSFKAVNDNGQIIVESNAMEKLEEINELELVVTNLPDGSFAIEPGTPEAQALIDAFVARNRPTAPVKTPVEVDTAKASADLQAFIDNANINSSVRVAVQLQTGNAGNVSPSAPVGVPAPAAEGYVPYDPAAWVRPPTGGGRQSGGDISGPGPKGKDSVLMWGAPGEHVLTADEVDALGGQGGAYALRAAIRAGSLPGFAEGGTVTDYRDDELARRLMWFGLAEPGTPDLKPAFGGGRFNPNMTIDTSMVSVAPPPGWLFQRGIESGSYPNEITFDDIADATVQTPSEWESYRSGRRHQREEASRRDPLWDWIAKDLPRYEVGGAIGDDPRIRAIDTAYQHSGKPYNYGPWDCSMYLSYAYAGMTGQPPGRYFNTESDFEALGFKRGYKPGALNVGIRRGGGGRNSHMAGTLPNGVNIENSSNGSIYGDGAAGAQDFPIQYYYEPPNAGDMGAMQAQAMGGQDAAHMNATGGGGIGPSSGAMGDTGTTRTEGYIPAGAGNSGRAGNSFASGLIDMGAEAINGIIDQAASAASSAAGMAAMAGSFGADGGAGGMAAQMAIGMGAQAAKRGVQWGADMIGIGIDAGAEILSPFGVPRFFSTDPTSFMPNFNTTPAGTTTAEALSNGVDPNTTQHGTAVGAAPGPTPAQANLAAPNPDDLQPQVPGLFIGEINGMDPDQVGNELLRLQQLNAMQYQGRP